MNYYLNQNKNIISTKSWQHKKYNDEKKSERDSDTIGIYIKRWILGPNGLHFFVKHYKNSHPAA